MARALSLALTLLVAALAAPAAQAQDALPEHFFTMNGGGGLSIEGPLQDIQMRNVAASGVTAVRRDILWNVVENTPPAQDPAAPGGLRRHFDWSSYDRWVSALARAGLTWRPILNNSPYWNRTVTGVVTSPPADPALAAGLARAILERYGIDGAFWAANPALTPRPVRWIEAWNEPNLSPSTNGVIKYAPAAYAGFLRAVAEGAHAADPESQVVVGGLVTYETTSLRSMAVQEFLDKVATSDPRVAAIVDGVAFHIYGTDVAAVMKTVGVTRDQIDATAFRGAPLHLNELGQYVKPSSLLGEDVRARYLEQIGPAAAAAAGPACGMASIAPYTWITSEVDPLNAQHWFGIANLDGTLKPSARAWARGVAAAKAGDTPCGSADRVAPGAVTGLTATAGDGQVTLDWADSPETDLAGYEVWRSATAGGPYTQVATPAVSTWTDTGVSNGTDYHYVVKAVDKAGNVGAASGEVSARPVAAVFVPAQVSGLVATAGEARVTVDWSDVTGAAAYEVWRSTAAGGEYTRVATPAVSAYLDTAVTPGVAYYYGVRAVSSAGVTGEFTAPVTATPLAPVALALTVTKSSSKSGYVATLRWTGARTSNVDIYRDGARIKTTANDGSDTDVLKRKPRSALAYKVCEAGTSTCSDSVAIRF